MKKISLFLIFTAILVCAQAQDRMNPELLWQLGRVSPVGLSNDGKAVIFRVTTHNVLENKKTNQLYQVPVSGGAASPLDEVGNLVKDKNISPDGKYRLLSKSVKVKKVTGQDFYPELKQSNAYIFDQLNYRHWDSWEDGLYNHVCYAEIGQSDADAIDIMPNEPYDSPQMPFGGDEDYIWGLDSKGIIYVCKKKYGTEYATSTNTDIYLYSFKDKATINLTDGMKGYDTHPLFGPSGNLAWLSMKNDGFEADKNDIYLMKWGKKINLTAQWDGTVDEFLWSKDGKKIFFAAPTKGTQQLFELVLPNSEKEQAQIKQITDGVFDIATLIGQSGDLMLVTRTDINHAAEIYSVDLKSGKMQQLSHVNDESYGKLKMSKTEKRLIKTTDGQEMVTWVVYPPDFDPSKKYPALLYCQGGPQSALTQFYSFRWNLQLMAAQGYIVVAPNRRGMPGHGVKWNADISTDWGGQCMRDYLSAIDDLAKEPFVDKNRLGCVGASFGGYSAFYLAGKHEGRFKTFISHCGLFNLESMYGTTEELFFVNWDMGGAYWDKNNAKAQKTFNEYNPINFVDKWNTPIFIIQGGKDFRVPIGQGMEAFQAAQLRGIKSKFLYLPDENHWVLNPQNAMIWQKEFFKWLDETLK